MSKELQIRNSTVDFLVFTRDAGEDGIEVRVQNGDVWLTQKAISQLFDVDRSVITKYLSNIFKEGELDENSVCAKFAQTADDGKTYNYKFYSLAAIIAVGYRINSERATQFRTWATKVLDTFPKQGSKILFLIQGVGKTIGSFTFGWDAMQILFYPRKVNIHQRFYCQLTMTQTFLCRFICKLIFIAVYCLDLLQC